MPIYEYICPYCNTTVERLKVFVERGRDIEACSSCGSPMTRLYPYYDWIWNRAQWKPRPSKHITKERLKETGVDADYIETRGGT